MTAPSHAAAPASHGQPLRLPYAAPLLVALDHSVTAFGMDPISDGPVGDTATTPAGS